MRQNDMIKLTLDDLVQSEFLKEIYRIQILDFVEDLQEWIVVFSFMPQKLSNNSFYTTYFASREIHRFGVSVAGTLDIYLK